MEAIGLRESHELREGRKLAGPKSIYIKPAVAGKTPATQLFKNFQLNKRTPQIGNLGMPLIAPVHPKMIAKADMQSSQAALMGKLLDISNKMLSLEPSEVFKAILEFVKELGFERAYIYECVWKDDLPHLRMKEAANPEDVANSRYSSLKIVDNKFDPAKYEAIRDMKIVVEDPAEVEKLQQSGYPNHLPGIIIPLISKNGKNTVIGILKIDNAGHSLFNGEKEQYIGIFQILANLAGAAIRITGLHKELSSIAKQKQAFSLVHGITHWVSNSGLEMLIDFAVREAHKLEEAINKIIHVNEETNEVSLTTDDIGEDALAVLPAKVNSVITRLQQTNEALSVLEKVQKQLKAIARGPEIDTFVDFEEAITQTIHELQKKDFLGLSGKVDINVDLEDAEFRIGDAYSDAFYEIFSNSLAAIMNRMKEDEALKGQITVRGFHEGTYYQLEIIDNGIGMDEEQVNSINEYGKFGYYALGTVLVRSIIELRHGSINYESKKGKGTKVVIRIPLI